MGGIIDDLHQLQQKKQTKKKQWKISCEAGHAKI